LRLPPLLPARLLRRYKRFLADVRLPDGRELTAHCPNTGSMRGCALPGAAVRLSRSERPGRKLPYTWELSRAGRSWVMVNTHRANRIAEEAIATGRIPALQGYRRIRREVPYGRSSRIDLLLEEGPRGDRVLVEVKNVTLVEGKVALFPDAVTERGRKHLEEMVAARDGRTRAVMLYCVSRGDATCFSPADEIDPAYGRELRRARRAGLEALAYACRVGPAQATMLRRLAVRL
jgi:sugar fermentation stimulation protein A